MQELIIADTSCLILFDKIGLFGLLENMYRRIHITEVVRREFGAPLPPFILITTVSSTEIVNGLDKLDAGEASCIRLALSNRGCVLIMDEAKGRTIAKKLGLHVTGTLGILLEAKRRGLLTEIRSIILSIQETDFRMSDSLLREVMRLADEKF